MLVSAWEGGECLGSALGEAGDAEAAEVRAEERLRQRLALPLPSPPVSAPAADSEPLLQPLRSSPAPVLRRRAAASSEPPLPAPAPSAPGPMAEGSLPRDPLPAAAPEPEPGPAPVPAAVSAAVPPAVPQPAPQPVPQPALELPAQTPAPGPDPSSEPSPDPEDWSDDLARIDLEVQRLGWDRNQEAVYLQRAFGHPSRSRLTRYGDLVAYLQALAQLSPGADPALVPLPLRRRDLLEQCDELLRRLGWDPDQGRLFLELHFQCASRQHLSDQQLLQFNMLLEEQLIQALSPTPA